MKTVVYLRVSTKEQKDKGHSLPAQRQDCIAYALKAGLKIIEIIEEDITGTTLDRPGLTQARELLRTGKATAILAYDSDRISREPEHYIKLRQEWKRQGTALHFALRGQINLDDFGHQLFEDMQARFSEKEKEKILERTRKGKREKAEQGNVINHGQPPFGYSYEGGQYVIVESEAEVIRLIFRLYTEEGFSIRAITNYLSENQTPSPADLRLKSVPKHRPFGSWSKGTIQKILKRETYAGIWRYTGQIPVEVPAIISRETWQAAQEQLKHNKKFARRNSKRDYLLGKRLICAQCDCAVYADGHYGKNGNIRFYYFCGSKHYNTATVPCQSPYFRVSEVDNAVWGLIEKVLDEPNIIYRALEKLEIEPDLTGTELSRVKEQVRRKEAALAKLLRLYSETDSETEEKALLRTKGEMTQELEQLQKEQAELESRVKTKPDRKLITDRLTMLHHRYQEIRLNPLTLEEKKAFVEALEITAYLIANRDVKQIAVDFFGKSIHIVDAYSANSSRILEFVLPVNAK